MQIASVSMLTQLCFVFPSLFFFFFHSTLSPGSLCFKLTRSRPSVHWKKSGKVYACSIRDGKHLSPGCPGFFKAFYYFIIFSLRRKKKKKGSHIHILASITQAAIIREDGSAVQASLKTKNHIIIFKFCQIEACIC